MACHSQQVEIDAVHLILPQFVGGDQTFSNVRIVVDQALGIAQRRRLLQKESAVVIGRKRSSRNQLTLIDEPEKIGLVMWPNRLNTLTVLTVIHQTHVDHAASWAWLNLSCRIPIGNFGVVNWRAGTLTLHQK